MDVPKLHWKVDPGYDGRFARWELRLNGRHFGYTSGPWLDGTYTAWDGAVETEHPTRREAALCLAYSALASGSHTYEQYANLSGHLSDPKPPRWRP
jgi:hypothetical protein